jgi:peptidoglycan/xylan/chitin deacetylase (PgdA/CDA1 family)
MKTTKFSVFARLQQGLIMISMILAAMSCAGSSKSAAAKTQSSEEVVVYDYTAEAIQAEIDANWHYLGYSARPDKYLAVSFDDGPSSTMTPLLDTLEQNKIKATFFVIGDNIRANRRMAELIYGKGHELGNHSDNSEGLGTKSAEQDKALLEPVSGLIQEITGKKPAFFRAPNLDYGQGTLTGVVGELGMALIGTNVIGIDWEDSITVDKIVANVMNSAHDGGIILLHVNPWSADKEAKTLQAFDTIIENLRSQGYWLLSVGQLAYVKNRTLEAGVRYDDIR